MNNNRQNLFSFAKHVGIIMDGNRRWATANNLPSYEGHKKGAENLWNIINNIQESKLKFLTVFVFWLSGVGTS